MPQLDWDALLAAENPPLRYKAVKGIPLGRWSGWLDRDTGDDLSDTYWDYGVLNYADTPPEVWVDVEIERQEWLAAKSRKAKLKIGYLLHPEKFEELDPIDSAFGFVPNLNAGGPGKPLGYALEIIWRIPVHLSSKPGKMKNPRGWLEGYGQATAVGGIVGDIRILNNGKVEPVYERIYVHAPGDEPPDEMQVALD